MGSYSNGTQGGQALQSVRYNTVTYEKNLTVAELNSKTYVEIKRIVGQQIIFLTYNSSPPNTVMFGIRGGTNGPQAEVLPMFPSNQYSYNESINYVLETEPEGCVVEMLPRPRNTTLINQFHIMITSSLWPSGSEFQLNICPFSSSKTNSLCQIKACAGGFSHDVNIRIVCYRAIPGIDTYGTLSSFSAPAYYYLNFPKLLNTFTTGVINISRCPGYQTITVKDLSNSTFLSFDVDYGIIEAAGGYVNLWDPSISPKLIDQNVNCTTQLIRDPIPIMVSAQVIVTDLVNSGRVLKFTFFPFTNEPTVEIDSSSTNPYPGSVLINVQSRKFYYV